VLISARAIFNKSREIDRSLGRYAERLSRFIWPWREPWLFLLVGLLAILDFTSTYFILELSGKNNVYESGLLAVWALDRGGFAFLLVLDIAAATVLSLAALTARYLYIKHGTRGYGRAAFVFLLTPYVIIAAVAIVNNVVLLFG
jgi:hypothetical protein